MVLGGHDLDWEVGKVYSEQVASNLSSGSERNWPY